MKVKVLFAILLMATVAGASAETGNGRFYLGLDVFTVADAADEWKKNASDAIDLLVNSVGYDSAGYKMETTAGIGARLGILFPFKNTENANWGGSIGYVKGPATDIDVHAESTLTTQGLDNEKIETSFIRMMFEIGKSFPVGSGTTRFRIGAGAGAAYGKIESEETASGSFVTVLGAPSSTTNSKTWTGFTWEINPSFIIPSGTTEIELGARFAGFPTLKKSDDFSKFNWNPFGVYGALHF